MGLNQFVWGSDWGYQKGEIVDKTPIEVDDDDDKQAFDKLYEAMQEVGVVAARAIRKGKPGYKRALKQIMEICRSVE